MQVDYDQEIEEGEFNRHMEVGKMSDCETLEEAFARYGFKPDDNIGPFHANDDTRPACVRNVRNCRRLFTSHSCVVLSERPKAR